MTTDRSDAIVISLSPPHEPDRKIVFEPRSDGSYERVEKLWRDGRWHTAGSELIDHVSVSTPCADVLVPGATPPTEAGVGVDGEIRSE